MKKASLMIVALFVASTSFSQYKLRVNEVDEFEGTVKKFTSAVKMGKTSAGTRVNGEVMRIDDSIFIVLSVYSDLGCILQSKSTGHFKFTDGTVLEMYNLGETDCGDTGSFTFTMIEGDFGSEALRAMTESEIDGEIERVRNIFKTKRLEKVKLTGSEYYTILEVDEDAQDAFMHMISLVE